MKKIITAIGNNILNDKLRQTGKYEVIGKDIQYKEGILELLNERKDVDIIIISYILEGEIDFNKLIENILKLKSEIDIIVFIEEENKDLKNFLYERGIYKIYKNNQIDMQEIEIILESENSQNTKALNEEIKKLKQIIQEQNLNIEGKTISGKVTAITGSYGSGKSILTCALCKEFSKLKKKTLLIDFDTYNKSISVLYNTFSKIIDYQNIKNNILKVSEYENLLYIEESFLQGEEIFNIINELKKEYEQILIDTSGNFKSKCYGRILEISDNIVFIVVPTLCDLKKAINLYEVLREDFNVPIQKIKLVINKENNYSIDSLIIQKMFGLKKVNRNNKV